MKKISIFLMFAFFNSCSSFRGPGDLQTSNYKPADQLAAPESRDKNNPLAHAQASELPLKRPKIQNDLDQTSKEAMDDESEQNVFEHLPPQRKTSSSQQVHFDWPVDEARLSRGFINRKRKHHWGLDLANRKGTPILAAESGYVVYTGRQFHGYGKLIVIEHNDEWASLYAHLDKFLVKEGDFVKRGEAIGEMGRSGHATGSHLHFEIRDNRLPVDPASVLPTL
jgi:murein DD-endopeptidase MepM/ murein hydrolase activator NlpD